MQKTKRVHHYREATVTDEGAALELGDHAGRASTQTAKRGLNCIPMKPLLIECLIDREQTEMPSDYLPEAEGMLIAGKAMLRAAGYRPGSRRSRSWIKQN